MKGKYQTEETSHWKWTAEDLSDLSQVTIFLAADGIRSMECPDRSYLR